MKSLSLFLILMCLSILAPAMAGNPPPLEGLTIAAAQKAGAVCAPSTDAPALIVCRAGEVGNLYFVRFNEDGQAYLLGTSAKRKVDSQELLFQTYGKPGGAIPIGDALTFVWGDGVTRRIAFLYPDRVDMTLEIIALAPARSTASVP